VDDAAARGVVEERVLVVDDETAQEQASERANQ